MNLKLNVRNLKKLIIILIALNFFSCMSVKKLISGVKNPKIESKESIINYLEKNEIETNHVAALKDVKEFSEMFQQDLSFPNFLIFNKEGELINPNQKKKYVSDVNQFMQTLDVLNSDVLYRNITDDINLNFIRSRIVDLDGNAMKLEENEYFMICVWAKFMGKRTTRKVKKYVDAANKKDNLSFVLLTFDPQEFWKDTVKLDFNN